MSSGGDLAELELVLVGSKMQQVTAKHSVGIRHGDERHG